MFLLIFIIGSIECMCISESSLKRNTYSSFDKQVQLNTYCSPITDSFEHAISGIKQRTMPMYTFYGNGSSIVYFQEIVVHSIKEGNAVVKALKKYNIGDIYGSNGNTYNDNIRGVRTIEKVDCISTKEETCLIELNESIYPDFSRPTRAGLIKVSQSNVNAICIQLENDFFVSLDKFPQTFGVDVNVHVCKKTDKYECECKSSICETKLSKINSDTCTFNADKYDTLELKQANFVITFRGMIYNFTKESVTFNHVLTDKKYPIFERDMNNNKRSPGTIIYKNLSGGINNTYMKKNLSVDSKTAKPTVAAVKPTTKPTATTDTPIVNITIVNSTQNEMYHWSKIDYCIIVINGICDAVNTIATIYIVFSIFNNYVKLENTRTEYNLIRK